MSEETSFKLEKWYDLNKDDPYPSRIKKKLLAKETNLTCMQVSNWFKKRRRNIKSKVNHNRLSLEQKNILKNHFKDVNNQPSMSQIQQLKKLTNIDEKKIATWFTSERFKKRQDAKIN